MASYKMWPVHAVKNLRTLWTKKLVENTRDACTHLSLSKFVCTRINALVRLVVINLVVILRGMWARYSGNGCIYACAYKFGVGAGISRILQSW